MVVDGILCGRHKITESGRNSASKHQPIRFILSVENERADAGRDGRTSFARPNFQARTGTTKKNSFPVQVITSRIGKPYPVDPCSAEGANHTYMSCICCIISCKWCSCDYIHLQYSRGVHILQCHVTIT